MRPRACFDWPVMFGNFWTFSANICRSQRRFNKESKGILAHKFEIRVAGILVLMNNFIILYLSTHGDFT